MQTPTIHQVTPAPELEQMIAPNHTSTSGETSNSTRIYYLDNVRAIAMFLGVVLHGALTYATLPQNFWILGDRGNSIVMDISIWFIHLFRMSLFFLIAGYFAKMLVSRRGVGSFIKNRLIRIVLPFVVFLPLVTVGLVSAIVIGIGYIENLPPLLAIIKAAPAGAPAPPPSTTHLWFLYYLIMFTSVSAVLCKVKLPFIDKLKSILFHPAALSIVPLILVPSIIAAGSPMVAPESFVPQWWGFGYYGLFYLTGWHLFGSEKYLDRYHKFNWLFLFISIVMYAFYYQLLPKPNVAIDQATPFWKATLSATLNAYLSVLLTLAALGFGKRCLSKPNATLRFISDSSYWTYLVHLPIILLVQVFLVDLNWNVWIKLLCSVSVTLSLCLISYVVFVRYTPVGWMLNGRKKTLAKSAGETSAAVAAVQSA